MPRLRPEDAVWLRFLRSRYMDPGFILIICRLESRDTYRRLLAALALSPTAIDMTRMLPERF